MLQVRSRIKREEERAKEEAQLDPKELEARRKRTHWRTKKKIKLLETFPPYMQEGFFGRNLMDTTTMEDTARVLEDMDVPPPPGEVVVATAGDADCSTPLPGVLTAHQQIKLNKVRADILSLSNYECSR